MLDDGGGLMYLPDQYSQDPNGTAFIPYSENGHYGDMGYGEYGTGGEYGDEYADQQQAHFQHQQGQFQAVNHVVGDGGVGISALHFDTAEELLWMGNQNGHVTSYYSPHLQKYTSFQVSPNEGVRSILSTERGILALTQTTLRCQIRRGLPVFTHSTDNMVDMQCMLQYQQRPNQLLMGGIQDKLISLDLEKLKEIQMHDTGGSCAILRYNGRHVGCGDTTGRISLRDPLSMNVLHTFDSHSGTLSDFDMNGHHLVTCGFARRHGNLQAIDRFLMVYDLRIMRSVSPLQCVVEPMQLRFLNGTTKIVVMSQTGQVQIVDVNDLGTTNLDIFQLETGGGMALSFDVSQTNHCLAFGDQNCGISLYTASGNENPTFNLYSRDTEFPHPLPTFPHMRIEDEMANYAMIPLPHLPPDQTQYVSDNWPDRFNRYYYRPVPEIEKSILQSMKMVGTIGYARNIDQKKRNVIHYNLKKQSDKDVNESRSGSGGGETSSAYKSSVPKRYKKNDIKLGKLGVDDFDFDNFNKTSFCGLEASLPNSYCNAMLQILYFTEKLRIILLNHFCIRESCLACELSYLFHMLDIGQGMPCQPANFLRALRTIPEASALGLIFSEANTITRSSVPRIIQSWNRFILQQIHQQYTDNMPGEGRSSSPSPSGAKLTASLLDWSRSSPSKRTPDPAAIAEIESISRDMAEVLSFAGQKNVESPVDDSPVAQLMGMKQEKITTCSKCQTKTVSDNLPLLCNLIYPEQSTLKLKISFAEILSSSLCPEQGRGIGHLISREGLILYLRYNPLSVIRYSFNLIRLRSLPYTLSLNAGMDNPADISFWNTQMHLILEQEEKEGREDSPDKNAKTQETPPQGQKACRYADGCTRSDCKFWHKGQQLLKDMDLDVADKLAKIGKSWVPFEVELHLASNGLVYTSKDDPNIEIIQSLTYELYAVCTNIMDPVNPDSTNLVSLVKVGPSYHARIGSPVSQWYIFNDFTINPIPKENPITVDVFAEDKTLLQKAGGKRITFTPLNNDELPRKGDLVAVDAEFVTLNQEESELRITCVRGHGRLEGVPFIDDYISTQEQVVDYLTKFSGIKPGDLDANFSSKHLTTLKSTYQKLRFLVDTGVIFIGHGLKNDFRVINVVVPSDQIRDTLYLYHLPHHRYVSLKFLAWYFLEATIQGVTHDSIEDAVTSLRLYKKYMDMKKDNTIVENLTKMYDVGKELNWKVPE